MGIVIHGFTTFQARLTGIGANFTNLSVQTRASCHKIRAGDAQLHTITHHRDMGCRRVHCALLEAVLNGVLASRVTLEANPNCPVHFRVVHCVVVHWFIVHHDCALQNKL